MPPRPLPLRLVLKLAALLADQSSRNRERKVVDLPLRRHSSGSFGRRNLERQLLDKRVRAAEYRLEPGPRSSAPQGTCDLVDHIIVKVEVPRVDGCLELDLESRSGGPPKEAAGPDGRATDGTLDSAPRSAERSERKK